MANDLTDAEKRLIVAVKAGAVANYSTGQPDQDDPAQGASWAAERTLRANVIRQLCLGLIPEWQVDPKGVRIHGAKVDGDLDLEAGTIAFPLELTRCHMAGQVNLIGANIKRLTFSGTWLCEGLNATDLVTDGGVYLDNGFSAEGEVRLQGADIGRSLECDSGTFKNSGGNALSADSMTVKGSVFLSVGFNAKGKVRLVNAKIGGHLECNDGAFEDPGGEALFADSMTVKGSVFLSIGFNAKGKVRLVNAEIGGNLECNDGAFENPGSEALSADGISVKGSVLLKSGFNTKGEVRLLNAEIGGDLDCDNGAFENPGGDALCVQGITVKGSVLLRSSFHAKGEVSLLGAEIGGDLDCDKGTFENPEGQALSAERTTAKGSVFLRNGFSAKGEVILLDTEIGRDLDCDNGAFENPGGDALSAHGITVKGSVLLRSGFSAKGEVNFLGAEIGGDLDCDKGTFENPEGEALSAVRTTVKGSVLLKSGFSAKGEIRLVGADIGGDLECRSARFEAHRSSDTSNGSTVFSLVAARVEGILVWQDLEILGRVKLAHAKADVLDDEQESWPDHGSFDLNGFEYDELAVGAPANASERVDWIRRQVSFQPQPYEQAVRVLRRMGHDSDAREVAIAKQVALRESGLLSHWGKRRNRFLEVTVGYGYKPWRALVYVLGFYLVGLVLFHLGFSFGILSPTDSRVFLHPDFVNSCGTWLPSQYPRFWAPLYSLDVFLPIVDLHQESRWLPNMRNNWGWALWGYMWIHIIAGWVLTSVFVAALTGIIKKD
ncbi:MAG: hypothetical protein MI806_06010 [Minwuiales bacterium]|nr:hypothetical protein [Minwuiales bacterium]